MRIDAEYGNIIAFGGGDPHHQTAARRNGYGKRRGSIRRPVAVAGSARNVIFHRADKPRGAVDDVDGISLKLEYDLESEFVRSNDRVYVDRAEIHVVGKRNIALRQRNAV